MKRIVIVLLTIMIAVLLLLWFGIIDIGIFGSQTRGLITSFNASQPVSSLSTGISNSTPQQSGNFESQASSNNSEQGEMLDHDNEIDDHDESSQQSLDDSRSSIQDLVLQFASNRENPFTFPRNELDDVEFEAEVDRIEFSVAGIIHNSEKSNDSLAILKIKILSQESDDVTSEEERFVTVRVGDWIDEYVIVEIESTKVGIVRWREGEITDQIEVSI